jgi:CheY-like chemotaxis protein
MPGDHESALAAGASDYLTKPVDLDEVLRTMARWVAPNGAVTGAAESDATAESDVTDDETPDAGGAPDMTAVPDAAPDGAASDGSDA